MRFKICSSLIVLLVIVGILCGPAGAARQQAHNAEKSLDIERYPNEPLELLDIKINGQSVKANINTKFRRNGEGLDVVKFEAENGWFKHVHVRLRNVSDKTMYGMKAALYFTPQGAKNMFMLPLSYAPRANPRGRLMPGEEVELVVDGKRFDLTMEIFKKEGADADAATVALAIESASFGDEQQWNRGNILRKDPNNPNRWITN